jgi:hypothetical protein
MTKIKRNDVGVPLPARGRKTENPEKSVWEYRSLPSRRVPLVEIPLVLP